MSSIPNQVFGYLGENPTFHTTREIAEALGLETKVVSSAVSRLAKQGTVIRSEDGKTVAHFEYLTLADVQAGWSAWNTVTESEVHVAATADAEGVPDLYEGMRTWRGNYSIVYVPLAEELGAAVGNVQVTHRTTSAVLRTSYITGAEADVRAFVELLGKVEADSLAALTVWQKENRESRRGLTDMQKFILNRNFILGYVRTTFVDVARSS
jgi:hypothetical protein